MWSASQHRSWHAWATLAETRNTDSIKREIVFFSMWLRGIAAIARHRSGTVAEFGECRKRRARPQTVHVCGQPLGRLTDAALGPVALEAFCLLQSSSRTVRSRREFAMTL